MRHGKLTRELAIEMAGIEAVDKVERENCEFTNRVMDEVEGVTEFSAGVRFIDNEGTQRTLEVYYYQDTEKVQECENLDELDWEIEGYEIW